VPSILISHIPATLNTKGSCVGKTKEPFVFNVAGMWLIRILGTFICIRFFSLGLVAAWACMIMHNLFLFAMFLYCYLSGKWNPLRT